MSYRRIRGLKWASALAGKPRQIPTSRPRGSKALGLRYERAVAKALGGYHGVWFEFIDQNGPGFCQVDLILPGQGGLLLFECKYTDTPEAVPQLRDLYLPVVTLAMRQQCRGIIVAKVLTSQSINVVASLDEALASASLTPVWHLPRPEILAPSFRRARGKTPNFMEPPRVTT